MKHLVFIKIILLISLNALAAESNLELKAPGGRADWARSLSHWIEPLFKSGDDYIAEGPDGSQKHVDKDYCSANSPGRRICNYLKGGADGKIFNYLNDTAKKEVSNYQSNAGTIIGNDIDDKTKAIHQKIDETRQHMRGESSKVSRTLQDTNEILSSIDSDIAKSFEPLRSAIETGSLDDIPDYDQFGFRTTFESESGKKLFHAANYHRSISRLVSQSNFQRQGFEEIALHGSYEALQAADEYYVSGDESSGDQSVSVSLQLADLAAGLTPGVGWVKDIYECTVGRNLITGERLSDTERVISGIGVLTGGIFSKLKLATKSAKVLQKIAQKTGRPFSKSRGKEVLEVTVKSVTELTSKLTPGKIKRYMANVNSVPRQTLIKDMESIGLKLKGKGSPDGKFMEFIDHKGRVRAKIHPPDGVTTTNHLHIYDSNGKSLNKVLEAVKKTSPDAHMPIQ